MYVLMNPNSLMNGKHVHGTLITMEDAYVSNPPSQKASQDVKKKQISTDIRSKISSSLRQSYKLQSN